MNRRAIGFLLAGIYLAAPSLAFGQVNAGGGLDVSPVGKIVTATGSFALNIQPLSLFKPICLLAASVK